MKPAEPGATRDQLPVPRLLDALRAWQRDPGDGTTDVLVASARELAHQLGVRLARLVIEAPPLPALDAELDAVADAKDRPLHEPAGVGLGRAWAAGEPDRVAVLVDALETAIGAARATVRADRAERQLAALDQAVRGIGGVLDLGRVLQLIVDRVRELVDARYAALGIVDASGGTIERFVTSGISDEQRRLIGDLPHGHGLLGLIIRENRTYRIREISEHPDSYGFPPNHPPMHSFLGTPITTQREAVGRLYLTDKLGAPEFSEQDQALVEMFARHAGIAIENARLHDQVRRLAVVDERDRISRDLHDSAIQAIYAQTLALDDVPDLVDDDPAEARRRVDESIDALHAVIRDIRNFIFGLRPVLLESGTLADGLRHLATELHRNGGVQVDVRIDDPDGSLDELQLEVVAELLTIVREALSNVARHAAAATTVIGLDASDERIRLEMADDGVGFRADESPDRGHHGLANMRARTEAMRGRFEVESMPTRGTRIIITLPRSRRSRSEAEVR
jgi:signal transduction histidine kinase